MDALNRIKTLQNRLLFNVTKKGVATTGNETMTELIAKVSQIDQSTENLNMWQRNAVVAGKIGGTEITQLGDMNFPIATSIAQLFEYNKSIKSVGNIYAPTAKSIAGLFNGSVVEEVGTIYAESCSVLGKVYYNCASLVKCGGVSMGDITSINQPFYGCKKLKEITNPFDFSHLTSIGNSFGLCHALQSVSFIPYTINVDFDIGSCSALSSESIQSVIDGLADLTDKDTCTVTFSSIVNLILTEEQLNTINSKNWRVG